MTKLRRYVSMPLPVFAGVTFACAITSPAVGASVTQGTPLTITGTLTGAAVVVQVKLGSTVLGSASIVGLTWSYSWTPQGGDIGAQTINATATSPSGTQASAVGITITVAANGPSAILGAQLAWWIDGVTSTLVDAGGGVLSSATDASGHGFDATFTVGHRPSIIASGLSGHPTFRCTTAQYGGNSSFTAVAPGTTPQYYFMVVKSTSLPLSGVFLGTAAAGNFFVGGGSTIADFNGGGGATSTALTAGVWYIVEAFRSNSASDYVQINGVTGTAGNAGNNAQTAYMLNANTGGAQGNDCEFATAFEFLGTPTPTQRTNLRAWARTVWPAIP